MNATRVLAAATMLGAVAACGGPGGLAVSGPFDEVATVVCADGDTRVEPAAIRPQADGVHRRVDNPTDEERMVVLYMHGSEVVPPGGAEMVRAAAPGQLRIACVAPGDPDEADLDEEAEGPWWPYPSDHEWVTLEVVDELGIWGDTSLGCEHPWGHHPDHVWDLTDAPMPRGRAGDPVDLARGDFEREIGALGAIRRGDVLELAGYPEETTAHVRLVRDGEGVAIVSYRPDGEGGWHLGNIEYCEDEGEWLTEPAEGEGHDVEPPDEVED
jgi:hypothetical protein